MAPIILEALPLTHEAWAPFGDVIQGTEDPATMPAHVVTNNILVNPIPGHKFNRVSPIISTYADKAPAELGTPKTAISIIRIGPPKGLALGGKFELRMFERHAATTQAFIPLAKAEPKWEQFTGEKALVQDSSEGMIVVGCLNGADDKPDLSTLKVFLASPSQGVCYHAGIWHHSIVSLGHQDYAAIDTQITTNSSLKVDAEILRLSPEDEPHAIVQLPALA
ncbi:hypothetical protein T439DRAFT_320661 [Meredithblackwellia eburnea MCA 4105]